MTIKEKLEQALKTPNTKYTFRAMWVELNPPVLYEEPRTTITKRKVDGRLINCQDGVLYIDTESTVETLQLEDLTDMCRADGKPMTQSKMGFGV